MEIEELKDILINDAEYDEYDVEQMTRTELLDAWLKWEGIFGRTEEILNTIANIWNVTFTDE